ncbi:MAG: hypothetical protein LAN71_17720 [Acidobacteriia bacterium]|nr:hypothetical protein [Terriglobia bacterium]
MTQPIVTSGGTTGTPVKQGIPKILDPILKQITSIPTMLKAWNNQSANSGGGMYGTGDITTPAQIGQLQKKIASYPPDTWENWGEHAFNRIKLQLLREQVGQEQNKPQTYTDQLINAIANFIDPASQVYQKSTSVTPMGTEKGINKKDLEEKMKTQKEYGIPVNPISPF